MLHPRRVVCFLVTVAMAVAVAVTVTVTVPRQVVYSEAVKRDADHVCHATVFRVVFADHVC